MTDTSWLEHAACRDMDPALFYPEQGDVAGSRAAKRICAGCPVIGTCLTVALERVELGIWGGTTELERRYMPRSRRRCVECDSVFTPPHRNVLVCSDACRRRRHARQQAESRRRVAPGREGGPVTVTGPPRHHQRGTLG